MASNRLRAPLVLALAALLVLGGCAGRRDRGIIVDTKGVNPSEYQRDLAECEAYADQVQAGEKVAAGAVGGAVIGGALGAISGSSERARRSAVAGAAIGGTGGVADAAQERRQVVRNCLVGRGYRVLN
ncbi:MAG: hypothetical protein V2I63_09395 [Pseudomonadales bacterium]|jgi:hypothetical protein|nr:hypothetical protein [Pseudomonadales bacterium]